MRYLRKWNVGDRPRLVRLLLSAAILLLVPMTGSLGRTEAAEAIAGQLFVRDAITVPGRAVRIEARLVRPGLLGARGLGGEPLEFWIAEKKAGVAMTGGDGRAFFEYTPRMRGTQTVAVRLASTKRVHSPDAAGIVASWERRRAILLVDVAGLVEAAAATSFPLPSLPLEVGPRERPAPLPEAVEELKRLTDYYFNVVYVVRSVEEEETVRGGVRAWLGRHRLPAGLLMAAKSDPAALGRLVDALRAEGWTIKAGVGRTKDFAEVLVERRVAAVILPATVKDEDLPKKARAVKDWKEVRRTLQG
jgi:hypothetical protein